MITYCWLSVGFFFRSHTALVAEGGCWWEGGRSGVFGEGEWASGGGGGGGGWGGGGAGGSVRAQRRGLRRGCGAEARVQPGDLEMEVDHRGRVEPRIDRALGTRSRYRVRQAMGAVHQLGRRDGRDCDVLAPLCGEEGVEIEVRALGRDQDAGVD